MAEKDITEKKLTAYNDVFSDIVNNLLFGGKRVVSENELEEGRTRSIYNAKDKTVREQDRDICKIWKKENVSLRLAFFGLENETEPEEDMPFRVIGYDGAAYRDEIRYITDKNGERKKEIDRYPVITLVLYLGYKKHWDKPKSIYEMLGDKLDESLKPYVQDYRMNLFEIAWLTDEQVAGFRSDFRILADYLVQMRKNGNYVPSDMDIVHIREVLNVMNAVTGDIRFVAAVDRDLSRKEDGKMTMKSFLSEAVEAGEARGEANAAKLLNFLWKNGRSADAEKAETDPAFLKELLKEYQAAAPTEL